MDKVKVFYNKETDTLDVWFDEPKNEVLCEEVGEGIILKKNKEGKVIGIEKLYVARTLGVSQPLPVEIIMV